MKGNKVHAAFISKFSSILSKFKDSSTVHVGHEQLKTFFNEYTLKEIIVPFITKMDTSDNLSEREKKEYTKVYISLIDCYKEKILTDQYYQKIMESLSKKAVGVSEVISFICKNLLNKIQDPQNLYPFISIIVSIFRNHIEIAKILKQVIEVIDPNVICAMQDDIMTILHEKIGVAKSKNEFMDTILTLVLNLEDKLNVHPQIYGFLSKYLKHEDWSCRKTCVDIGNALLIINHEISESIHKLIKELKYDKIKHVRESVNNYQILYKQTYGQETPEKPNKHYTSFRETKTKTEIDKKVVAKSPAPVSRKVENMPAYEKSNSLEKSLKGKRLNQNFFKNAKDSDVIKIGDQNQSVLAEKQKEIKNLNDSITMEIPEIQKTLELVNEKANNFEAYLKNRGSPRGGNLASPKTSQQKGRQIDKRQALFNSRKAEASKQIVRFNYQNELQSFKKRNRQIEPQSMKSDLSKEGSLLSSQVVKVNENDLSLLSFAEPKNSNLLEQFLDYFKQFEKKVCNRLDRLEERIQMLESERNNEPENSRMLKGRVTSQRFEGDNARQGSPRSYLYNESPSQSQFQSASCQPIESNIQEKVKVSVLNENWDEAFTLALTNNRKNILLNLFERCVLPTDKTVEECILLQIKKLLGYTSALKWLKYFLTERTLSSARLMKLREQLLKRGQGDTKNYQMMRQLVLNEITDKFDVFK